jgi:ABC-type antimicrobial peptide transport system permease subunit
VPSCLSPSVLGSKRMATLRPTLILIRYTDPAALEQVRNLMFHYLPNGSLQTRETSFDGYSKDARHLYRVVTIATVGIFATAGLGLVVAVAIGLVERRRPFALLRAAGTPLKTLRRTIFLEAAVPLLFMSTLAAALGVFVGKSLVAHSSTSAPVSLVELTAPTAVGVLVCLLVIAGALPLVGRATATEETRFE